METCPLLHKHRIVPGHMGGTYEANNVILLTIEQHADAHKTLWEQHGRWQDYYAWQGLSGQIGRDELQRQINSEAGKKGGRSRAQKMHGDDNPFFGKHHTDETKEKVSKAKRHANPTPVAMRQRRHREFLRTGIRIPVERKPVSEETKLKMRVAHLGQRRTPEQRERIKAAAIASHASGTRKPWGVTKGSQDPKVKAKLQGPLSL